MGFVKGYREKRTFFHSHQYYEAIVYFGGTGTLHTEKKDFAVADGTLALIPPKTAHWTSTDGDLQSIYIGGDFNYLFQFTEPMTVRDGERKEGLLLAQMLLENYYGNPDYCEALGNAFAHYILNHLTFQDPVGKAVSEIVRKITTEYHDSELNLCTLLNESGYAEDYIRACFKRIVGKTPGAFLTELRIRHACQLISVYQNALPLSKIAEWCGYTDYAYFSKRFKQETGVSPQQYNKKVLPG